MFVNALRYATSGVGNSTHLAMELLKMMTITHMLHVPYKATSQKNMDVISGQDAVTKEPHRSRLARYS